MSLVYNMDTLKGEIEKALKEKKTPEELLSRLISITESFSLKTPDTELRKQIEASRQMSYKNIVEEMKCYLDKGTFITGLNELDNLVCFSVGDFIIIQARSSHGKSSFIADLAHRFPTYNKQKNSIIIWITYESSVRKIKCKLLNTISSHLQEGKKIITRDRFLETDLLSSHVRHLEYLFGQDKAFEKTIETFENFASSKSLYLLQKIELESLQILINVLKDNSPNRPIILFLDYIQIVRHNLPGEGWQKIKELAYYLEAFAIDNDLIIFTGSQVNEMGEVREGKDIYNASTIVIDLFNHSHQKIKEHKELSKHYKDKKEGKAIVSLSIEKNREGETKKLSEYLLFDGFKFEENPNYICDDNGNNKMQKKNNYNSSGGINRA